MIALPTVDLHEGFADSGGVAVTPELSVQSPSVKGSESDVPRADGLSANDDASFGQEIFDMSVTQIETAVVPDGIRTDIRRKTVAPAGIHQAILLKPNSIFVSTGVHPGSGHEPVHARV
jgi:hypothetical protein